MLLDASRLIFRLIRCKRWQTPPPWLGGAIPYSLGTIVTAKRPTVETHLRPCLGLAWLGETENKPIYISKGVHAICVVATDDFLNTANTSKQKNYCHAGLKYTAGEPIFRQRGYVRTYIPYMVWYIMSVPLFSSCMYVQYTHVRTRHEV